MPPPGQVCNDRPAQQPPPGFCDITITFLGFLLDGGVSWFTLWLVLANHAGQGWVGGVAIEHFHLQEGAWSLIGDLLCCTPPPPLQSPPPWGGGGHLAQKA